MGLSTDAILVYGLKVSEDIETDFFDDENIEDYWNRWELGVGGECPFMGVWHCHTEYPMIILGYTESYQRASRGYPLFAVMDVYDWSLLHKFAVFIQSEYEKTEDFKEYEIDLFGSDDPAWLLCSNMG